MTHTKNEILQCFRSRRSAVQQAYLGGLQGRLAVCSPDPYLAIVLLALRVPDLDHLDCLGLSLQYALGS